MRVCFFHDWQKQGNEQNEPKRRRDERNATTSVRRRRCRHFFNYYNAEFKFINSPLGALFDCEEKISRVSTTRFVHLGFLKKKHAAKRISQKKKLLFLSPHTLFQAKTNRKVKTRSFLYIERASFVRSFVRSSLCVCLRSKRMIWSEDDEKKERSGFSRLFCPHFLRASLIFLFLCVD